MSIDLSEVFDAIDDDWVDLLDGSSLDKIIDELQKVPVASITPPVKNMFNFARYTPLDDVRVVIIGQDPYPTAGHAHGLAFSCIGAIPQSLLQIYKCLEKCKLIPRIPKTGDLTQWTSQGIVLLNRALTNIIGEKKAHTSLWNEYTRNLIVKLIQHSQQKSRGLIFILWGAEARQLSAGISKHANCKVLQYGHPSPMGGRTFIDCPNFIECNKLLTDAKQMPIDWNVEEGVSVKTFDEVIGYNDAMAASRVIVFVTGVCMDGNAAYTIYMHTKGLIKNKCIYGKLKEPQSDNSISSYVYGILRALEYITTVPTADDIAEIILLTDNKRCVDLLSQKVEVLSQKVEVLSQKVDLDEDFWAQINKKIAASTAKISPYYFQAFETGAFPKENFNNYCMEIYKYANEMARYTAEAADIARGAEIAE